MEETHHSHRFHLPKFLSKTGMKPSRQARINFAILGCLGVFLLFNGFVATALEGRVFPGVSVAGKDISFLTREEAYKKLKGLEQSRTVSLKVGDKVFETDSNKLGAEYDLKTTVDTAYSLGRDAPLPLIGLFQINKNGQLGFAYNLDLNKLKAFTNSVVNSVGHDPINATVKITDGVISTVPSADGLRIDQKALNNLIHDAISDGKDQSLSMQPQLVKAEIQPEDTVAAAAAAEELLNRKIVLNFEGRTYSPDRRALGYMIVFNEVAEADGKKVLQTGISKQQVAGYVQSVANEINITPVNKKVIVSGGNQNVEREGKDGRALNQNPVIDAIASALGKNTDTSVTLTTSPLAFKTETQRAGALDEDQYIEVNLSQQRLYAWKDGAVVFSTPITSGATGAGFPTVQGKFAVYAKERSRYLNGRPYGWNYNVFVDYWMPFTGGYGLHDADWRSSFGGPDFYYGGSHGCVNMPKGAAAFLFSWAPIGTTVWVHG